MKINMRILYIAINNILGDDPDMSATQSPANLHKLAQKYSTLVHHAVSAAQIQDSLVAKDPDNSLMDYNTALSKSSDIDTQGLLNYWHSQGADLFFQDADEIGTLQYDDVFEMI